MVHPTESSHSVTGDTLYSVWSQLASPPRLNQHRMNIAGVSLKCRINTLHHTQNHLETRKTTQNSTKQHANSTANSPANSSRRAFRQQFQLLGAGILICAFLSCCVHVSFYSTIFSSHLPLDWSVVVICWTATTVLCEPFVPYSLLEFWFAKLGGSCPSGSHKIQHSAPPSATVVLDSTDFLAGKGIARCATKRATVMLWKLRSSLFLPLSRHLPPSGTLVSSWVVSLILTHAFFTGFRGFREVGRPRVAVLEVADLKGMPPQLRPGVINFVLNGVGFRDKTPRGLRLVQNKALAQFKQVLSTPAIVVHK